MSQEFNPDRYKKMKYNHSGKSGLKLPSISLGLWHNFGFVDDYDNARSIIRHAFNNGITHFDLANNYGPPPGSAEENFGRILNQDFTGNLRDELIISTKAGYTMWDGPYGDWGSRKYLRASLDQSLKRLGLEYVDIFYHHRPDPNTPIEESMYALNDAVKQGKALYVGLSNYRTKEAAEAFKILKELGTPCLIHQPKYSMFERWVEEGLLDVLEEHGVGCIPFSPLAQGLLTNKYLHGIPDGSRASKNHFLKEKDITEDKLNVISQLNDIAKNRNQSLSQMALSWILKDKRITSVLVGVSSKEQLSQNIDALKDNEFTSDELETINSILQSN